MNNEAHKAHHVLSNVSFEKSCIQIVCEKMKETWDAKQLVPYITGPYNQPKAGVENVRSIKYKVSSLSFES